MPSPTTTSRSSTRSRARGLDGEVSIKLTQLGYDLDVEAAFRHFDRLAAHAAEVGTWPGSTWRAAPTSRARSPSTNVLRAARDNVGLCLQAYLLRTPADVQRLLPLAPGDPPGQGRLRRAGRGRLSLAARGRRRVPGPRHDARPGGPRRRGPPRGRDARRRAHRADRPAWRRDRARARQDRGRDALRDPGRPAAPAGRARVRRSLTSSPTASTGIRGTCAGSPSGRRT